MILDTLTMMSIYNSLVWFWQIHVFSNQVNWYQGFDGQRIGVNGFENENSDKESAMCKLLIEDGCRLKLSQNGDVLIKRDDDINIFVNKNKEIKGSVSPIIMKSPYGLIQQDKTYKLFDMNRFQENLSQEILSENPSWSNLEKQVLIN